MVAGAHRDALLIEQRRDVVGMAAAHRERDYRRLVPGFADDLHAFDLAQHGFGAQPQGIFVGGDRGCLQGCQEINCCAQPDGVRDIWRARFEAIGQFVEGGFRRRHSADHLAAELAGREAFQHFAATIQHADTGWPVHLVSGERIEVAAQRLHVDALMGHRLGAVDKGDCAPGFRARDKFGNGMHGAKCV